MQIKTPILCYYAPIRIAEMQTLITLSAGKDVEQEELSFADAGNAKWHSYFGK